MAAFSILSKSLIDFSFNTQPPEGGCISFSLNLIAQICFNTQPPEGGCLSAKKILELVNQAFQHTAARRRLLIIKGNITQGITVSTHSRPKAAARALSHILPAFESFNTQPPEGGCAKQMGRRSLSNCFNTQPPEGGCH